MSSPAYCHIAAYDAFLRGLKRIDTADGLAEAAFALAKHAYPQETLSSVLAVIDELASVVTGRVTSGTDQARLAHLHDVLFDVAGFQGAASNDYYLPENSYLPQVLRSKRGIPITLSLVYKLVAERVGLKVEGINAPGHFLVAVHCREAAGERRLYVDPFFGGSLLTADEAYERVRAATGQPLQDDPAMLRPASHTAWISRMLLNLQAIFSRKGNQRDLLATQELQSLLGELER